VTISGFAPVAVVGMGVVSPAGSGQRAFWKGLLSGRSVVRQIELSTADLPLLGTTVDDTARPDVLSHAEHRRFDRIADLGLSAAQEATDDAALVDLGVAPERIAVVVGTCFGGISTITNQHDVLAERGWRRTSPFAIPAAMPSAVASLLSIRFGGQGPVTTVSSACASGTQAIVEGVRIIRAGYADVVIAGGADAMIDPIPLAGFARMDAMSRRTDDPEKASRPFDADRDGFVLGEGAAFVILRRCDQAMAAGRPIHGLVVGTGLTADAQHLTAPDRDGHGARRCLTNALAEASLLPVEVVHINAHGTGTQLNDIAEARAIRAVFGADAPPATSCKGTLGHLMGGAGAVEFVATMLSMIAGTVPVTVNCDNLDPEIDLDVVQDEPRRVSIGPAITNSFGFGGQNAVLVVAPPIVGP